LTLARFGNSTTCRRPSERLREVLSSWSPQSGNQSATWNWNPTEPPPRPPASTTDRPTDRPPEPFVCCPVDVTAAQLRHPTITSNAQRQTLLLGDAGLTKINLPTRLSLAAARCGRPDTPPHPVDRSTTHFANPSSRSQTAARYSWSACQILNQSLLVRLLAPLYPGCSHRSEINSTSWPSPQPRP
jgi:hypothetical protein